MDKVKDKIISNFDCIRDDLSNNFDSLWELKDSFNKHIKRRISLGHIADREDYINKTLDCLANSNSFIFAQYDKSWDNICYNKSKDWAVVFNENGKIMTSYKIDTDSYIGFEVRHKSNNANITKGKTDEKFRKYFKNIRN